MTATTFWQFLREHSKRAEQRPRGMVWSAGPTDFGSDFLGDALADDTFPRRLKTFDELHDYMGHCGACQEALEGACDIWRDWLLYQVQNGTYETPRDRALRRALIRDARADHGRAARQAEPDPLA